MKNVAFYDGFHNMKIESCALEYLCCAALYEVKTKGKSMEKNENGYYVNEINNSYNMNIRNGNAPRQLAMVYSPYQCWRMLYGEEDALRHGTLFEELYKPLEDGCV